jgi:hypothetical protein
MYADSLFLNTNKYYGIEYYATGDLDNNGYSDILFASNQGRYWGVFSISGIIIFLRRNTIM